MQKMSGRPQASPSSNSSQRSFPIYPSSVDSRNTSVTSLVDVIDRKHPDTAQYFRQIDQFALTSKRQSLKVNRRQLSIEAVHCLYIEDSGHGSSAMFTLLVRPVLLNSGRFQGRSRVPKKGADRFGGGESLLTSRSDDEDDASDDPVNLEMDPYHVVKTASELVTLSNRLLASFETQLDIKRGGPLPLAKDTLQPKRQVKDLFRRKRLAAQGHKAIDSIAARRELINDFFLKALRAGGEVLSSSRAMQDFFHKPEQFEDDGGGGLRPPQHSTPIPLSAQEGYSPMEEETEELTCSPSLRSTPLSTPISMAHSDSKFRAWNKSVNPAATPTQIMRPGLIHSSSDADLPQALHRWEDEANRVSSVRAAGILHRSKSEQDLSFELRHRMQEICPAGRESSSTRPTTPSSGTHLRHHDITPLLSNGQLPIVRVTSSQQSTDSAQIINVSGVIVKARASGWRIVKGAEAPSLVPLSNHAAMASSKASPISRSPLRARERPETEGGSKGSAQSTPIKACQAESSEYIPSELERLIFGTTANKQRQQQQQQDGSIAASKSPSPSKSKRDNDQWPEISFAKAQDRKNEDSTRRQSGSKNYQRVKAKASHLHLDLSGQSNYNSESLKASSTGSVSSIKPVVTPLLMASIPVVSRPSEGYASPAKVKSAVVASSLETCGSSPIARERSRNDAGQKDIAKASSSSLTSVYHHRRREAIFLPPRLPVSTASKI